METIVRAAELPRTAVGLAGGSLHAISWRAILAGAAVSAALTLMMLALGTGIGLSVVSPWSTWSVTTTQAAMIAGIYMLVVAVMASAVGGYVAGRLRSGWTGVHSNEVYFRDTAHGVVTWAVATVVSAAFLGSAAAMISAGAASGAGSATAATAQTEQISGYVDRLLRPDYSFARRPPVVVPTTPPAAVAAPMINPPIMNAALRDVVTDRNDMGRLLAAALHDRTEVAASDRTYLSQMVAARTGLSAGESDTRVSETLSQMKANIDIARRATAQLALWLAASMLLGALAAGLAAAEGGGLRDGTFSYDR